MQADIKFLDRVIGAKKELYLSILRKLAEGFNEIEVGLMFNLTPGRISQVYTANKQLCDEITLSADLSSKAGRLRCAYRNVRAKEGRSRKDQLDWLEYIRREQEEVKQKTDEEWFKDDIEIISATPKNRIESLIK